MKFNLKHLLLLVVMIATSMPMHAADQFVNHQQKGFVWIANGKALPILVDEQEDKGIMRAVNDLQKDANAVTGITPQLMYSPNNAQALIIGSIDSKWIKQLINNKKIDVKADDIYILLRKNICNLFKTSHSVFNKNCKLFHISSLLFLTIISYTLGFALKSLKGVRRFKIDYSIKTEHCPKCISKL